MTAAILLWLLLAPGDSAWQSFSAWFAREGVPGAPNDVLKAYAAQLKSAGVADAEARVAEVRSYIAAHPKEALALHFDRIYTWKDAPFTREPSGFVKKIAATRKPGRALDIAMGQGRNSIWLAKNGWTVSGYDLSEEALRQAAALAREARVSLDIRRSTHEEFDLGREQWDLIVMCYAFTNLSDEAYMQRVYDSLKAGGLLVIDGFGGAPPTQVNPVLKHLMNYHVLYFEDLPGVADWGGRTMPLNRMALEKR